MRDELINREVFTTLLEAKILIENWRRNYSEVRPHSSLGYRPPAPEAIQPALTPVPLTQKVVSSLGAGQWFTGFSSCLTTAGWDIIIGPDDGENWALPYQELKWEIPGRECLRVK